MANPLPMRSEALAWVVGAVVVAFVSAIAFAYVGWLGIFIVGLIGMTVSVRLEMNDGNAVPGQDYDGHSVRILARQLHERAPKSGEQKQAEAARAEKRRRLIYLLNTAWLAMIGLGFAMFATHQL